MKINFVRNDSQKMAGYENINIATGCFLATILDQVVENAEADEIRAVDVIDFFPAKDTAKVLEYWIKKLRHNGKLVLVSTDCFEVARGLIYGKLDIDAANDLLYAKESETEIRKCSLTLSQIVEYLKSKGLLLEKARINNYKFIIEVKRP